MLHIVDELLMFKSFVCVCGCVYVLHVYNVIFSAAFVAGRSIRTTRQNIFFCIEFVVVVCFTQSKSIEVEVRTVYACVQVEVTKKLLTNKNKMKYKNKEESLNIKDGVGPSW